MASPTQRKDAEMDFFRKQSTSYVTNLVVNPSFERQATGNGTTPTGWNAYNTTSPDTYKGIASDFAMYGKQSFKMQSTAVCDSGLTVQLSGLTNSAKVTVSVWVKTDASVTNANVTLDTSQNAAGGATTNTVSASANNNGRITNTITLDSTKCNIFLGIGSFGGTSPGTVWYDGVLFTQAITPPPYFDGDSGFSEWTGTPHDSTSHFFTAQTLVDMKKAYFASKVSGATQETLTDLEYKWLATHAGVTGKTLQERWIQAYVAVANGQPVPATMEELYAQFYMLANS